MYGNLRNCDSLCDAQRYCFSFGSDFLPDVVTRTEGIYFWTASGARLMDWTSGQMSCLVGHGHPEVVAAGQDHLAHLDHLYSGMLSPPVIELARSLTDLLPAGLDKAMFLSTGGESNECAIRLAKMFTSKFEIVGLSLSWHGMTGAAQGVQYNSGRKGAGPMIPGMHMLSAPDQYRSIFRHPDGSHDWQTELDHGWSLIDRASCGSLAAVVIEPVLSSGGMIALPKGYMKAMKEHCERRGMLLIVDEAQTALGRSGNLFAIQHPSNDGIVPDILVMSKTLGNGIPLSAVITSAQITQRTKEAGFMFYTTHANDPFAAAIGLSVLSLVTRDEQALIIHAQRMGYRLHAGLEQLKDQFACIGAIRGRALMAGVEIVTDRRLGTKADIPLGQTLSSCMMKLGLSAMISARNYFAGCIRIAPPITITADQIDEGVDIILRALRLTPNTLPLA